MDVRVRAIVGIAIIGLAAVACAAPAAEVGAASPAASGAAGTDAAAEAYCLEVGGELVERVATSNTNADPSAQLPLAGRMTLCEFESGDGDATTRISVPGPEGLPALYERVRP